MKIKVWSRGETEFSLDAEYQEPAIREAVEDGCNDVASQIIDYTDTERSDISHDEYAVVSEDDGTEVWRGWLSGDPERPAPPEAGLSRDRLAAIEEDAEADEIDAEDAPEDDEEDERAGAAGTRGPSFANGNSLGNSPRSPWSWKGGYQAPPPVDLYSLTVEPRIEGLL